MSTPLNLDEPAFPFPSADELAAQGLTAQEFAAIQLRVPQSGTGWLDAMITEARRLDAVIACAAALVVNGADPEQVSELSRLAAAAALTEPEAIIAAPAPAP